MSLSLTEVSDLIAHWRSNSAILLVNFDDGFVILKGTTRDLDASLPLMFTLRWEPDVTLLVSLVEVEKFESVVESTEWASGLIVRFKTGAQLLLREAREGKDFLLESMLEQ
jgi:hypothetical protein